MKKRFLSSIAAALSLIFVMSCTALISVAAPAAGPVVLTPRPGLHSGNDNSNAKLPCHACTEIFSGRDFIKIDQGNGSSGVFTAKRSADGTSTLLTVSKTVTVSYIVLKAANQHQVYVSANKLTLEAGTVYRLNSMITNKKGIAQAISHITMYGISEVTSSEVTSSEATSSEVASSEATSSETTSSEATSSEATSSETTSSEATSSEATSSEVTSSEATSSEVTSSEATSSETTSSEVTSSETTSSETTSSEATSSETTSSEATSSEATSSEVTSSEMTSSEATSSEATSSETTSSEATSSETTSSEATSSEATSSEEEEEEITDEGTPLTGMVFDTSDPASEISSRQEEIVTDNGTPLAKAETPATGAESMVPLLAAAMVLSLTGAVWAVLQKRRSTQED